TFATAAFSITGASVSNLTQALTINAPISGGFTGSGNNVLTKSGDGTLVLTNASNSFGGGGSRIEITQGVLAVPNDGALGNSANIVRLTPSTGTSALR